MAEMCCAGAKFVTRNVCGGLYLPSQSADSEEAGGAVVERHHVPDRINLDPRQHPAARLGSSTDAAAAAAAATVSAARF